MRVGVLGWSCTAREASSLRLRPLPCRDTGRAIAVSPHQNPSNSLQWSVLFRWVSMGLISPEPLSLTMRRAAPLDFQELARASGVARQSLTLELKGSRPAV